MNITQLSSRAITKYMLMKTDSKYKVNLTAEKISLEK